MTRAGELLRDEIDHSGPVLFRRFMEVALYDPEAGYYRRDHFGRQGDFYTAEQLQPVFGAVMERVIDRIRRDAGMSHQEFTVVELGAGRGEMAAAFASWNYIPIDLGRGELPGSFQGVVFAHEFFDALPVDVAVRRGDEFRMMRVACQSSRFEWIEAEPAEGAAGEWLTRHAGEAQQGDWREIHLNAREWLGRIASSLARGSLVTVDYGYTDRELARFTRGTLMSYRRHCASEDVLTDPGERDITAHVPFSALEREAVALGFHSPRLERLQQTLVAAGAEDQFASALNAATEADGRARRLQLKTLLFDLGESFRVLRLDRSREAGENVV